VGDGVGVGLGVGDGVGVGAGVGAGLGEGEGAGVGVGVGDGAGAVGGGVEPIVLTALPPPHADSAIVATPHSKNFDWRTNLGVITAPSACAADIRFHPDSRRHPP
jgi:hypothetical protein